MSLVIDYSTGFFGATPTGEGVGTDPATIGDPSFADVSLLLHGDGTSGSTTITDSSSNAVSVTANGNAQIDTAVKKFGTGSIEFDGTGDYLSVNGSTYPLDLSGDFTVEFFVRHTNVTAAQKYISLGPYFGALSTLMLIDVSTNFRLFIDGSDRLSGSAGGPTINTWHYIAVVRNGTSIKYFLDGNEELNYTQSTPKDYSLSYNYPIGINQGLTMQSLYGYLDEFRISTVARYTSNFTPPTAAFSNTGPTLDLSSGNVFSHAPSSNVAYTFTNPPSSGTSYDFTLKVTGAGAYDISNAIYASKSFSIASQETDPTAVFFKPDGTKMYVTGTAADSVFEYDLSTAFDVSTAVYNSASYTYGSSPGLVEGLFFRADGLKWYIADRGSDDVWEYDMSTAWDITTSSFSGNQFDVNTQDGQAQGLFFKSDGTKFYVLGQLTDSIYQYSMSTAWDVSSASYDSVSFSVSSQAPTPKDLAFNNDGTKFYVLNNNSDAVYQYSLSTAWDLSTASYDSISFNVNAQEGVPTGLTFSDYGAKMYVVGSNNDTVYQYSTATPSTIVWPASVEWPSGTAPAAPASGETDVYTFFTTDGGTTYYGNQVGDAVS